MMPHYYGSTLLALIKVSLFYVYKFRLIGGPGCYIYVSGNLLHWIRWHSEKIIKKKPSVGIHKVRSSVI